MLRFTGGVFAGARARGGFKCICGGGGCRQCPGVRPARRRRARAVGRCSLHRDARGGVRRPARPEACGYPAPVFELPGRGVKTAAAAVTAPSPRTGSPCPPFPLSQAKRARRAPTLAKYANTPEPPPPKRARVRAALTEAQAASDRLDALLRGALAPRRQLINRSRRPRPRRRRISTIT